MRLEDYFDQVADIDDLTVATDKILDLVGKDWRTVLHGAVHDALLFHRRAEVRSIERQASRPNVGSDSEVHTAEVPSLNILRSDLLRSSFSVDGKKARVLWGEATVADHEARIAYLSKKVTGLGITIAKHEDAVSRIKAKRGAKCLNDLLPKGNRAA